MTIIYAFDKDPDEILDFTIDWSDWLPSGDTISTSAWNVPAGITEVSKSSDTTKVWIFLSGGIDGDEYKLTNTITTAGSRTAQRTIQIKVAER